MVYKYMYQSGHHLKLSLAGDFNNYEAISCTANGGMSHLTRLLSKLKFGPRMELMREIKERMEGSHEIGVLSRDISGLDFHLMITPTIRSKGKEKWARDMMDDIHKACALLGVKSLYLTQFSPNCNFVHLEAVLKSLIKQDDLRDVCISLAQKDHERFDQHYQSILQGDKD